MAKTTTDGIIDDHDYDTYCHHRFRRHGLILLGGMSGRGGTKFGAQMVGFDKKIQIAIPV